MKERYKGIMINHIIACYMLRNKNITVHMRFLRISLQKKERSRSAL